jgi:hypothetical protein
MADVIEQRRAILEGIDEKGLMIRTHGDDEIRSVQERRAHPALLVRGRIHAALHQIGADGWMHLLRESHSPRRAHPTASTPSS